MSIAKKRLFWLLLVAGVVALGFVMLRPPPFLGSVNSFTSDITHPDALIRSYSLSKLPPDLLRVPLARDLLTEDFVTYYQQNESRLALSGTLKRIAFEHRLGLPDRLIESTLDEAAEVALWRGGGGRLEYFAVVLARNTLAQAIQTILPAAAKAADLQLSTAGRLEGTDVEILVLAYGRGRHLLLLAKGDRVVVLSDPGMLLVAGEAQEDGSPSWTQREPAVKLVRDLLDGDRAISPFAQHFRLKTSLPKKKVHELTLGASGFAFGYETFMPGLKALGLSFDDRGQWQSSLLLDTPALENDALWAALPHGPSLCAALPVDWASLGLLVKIFNNRLKENAIPPALLEELADAAVCWYKDSRLYTPLFAARLKSRVDETQAEAFFALAAAASAAGEDETSFDAETGVGAWRGEVKSRFGTSDEDNKPRTLKPALALRQDIVFFSPDARLVDKALDVAAKRYPALADSFAGRKKKETLAFVDPEALSALLRKETFAALPKSEEPLFRNAAESYLVPRFDALARYPVQRINLGKERPGGWRTLEWEAK